MATNKTITILDKDGTSKQVAPESLSSDVATNAVWRTLLDLDWGTAGRRQWRQAWPLGDGEYTRGGVSESREVLMRVASRVNPGAAIVSGTGLATWQGAIEAVRDDEESALGNFLRPGQGPFRLRQARKDASNNTVTREIYAELQDWQTWRWSPDDVSDGMVGIPQSPMLVKSLRWRSLSPWFQDASVVKSLSSQTLDGTLRTGNLVNDGDHPCGLKITISGTSGTLTVQVTNTTTGYTADTVGNGITIAGINVATGDVVIDYRATKPHEISVLQGSTNKIGSLSAGASLFLPVATNELSWQVTSGTPSGCTITFEIYRLWSSP